MEHGFIKVAAVSPVIRLADLDYNMEVIKQCVDDAVAHKAQIIVFPELVTMGASADDYFFQRKIVADAGCRVNRLKEHFASLQSDALLFIGVPLEVEGKLYDVCAVIQQGQIKAFIPKKTVSPAATRYFSPADDSIRQVRFHREDIPFGSNLLLDLNDTIRGLVIGCEIGDDVLKADAPHVTLCQNGATLIVNPFAQMSCVTKEDYLRDVIRIASAQQHSAFVVAGAGEGESTTDGVWSSPRLIAENGDIIAEGELFTSGITYSEVDIKKLTTERLKEHHAQSVPARGQEIRRIAVFMEKTHTDLTRVVPSSPFIPEDKAEFAHRAEQILTMCAKGLQHRMEHIGSKDAYIGVSGGLDSTLALLTTVNAFDRMGISRKNIRAITMPCFGTSDRTRKNAMDLSSALHVSLQEIDITESVRQHLKDIGHDEADHNVTFENAQARERTQILMDLANETNGIVVGTGDLSELVLGWATYNGDHMSMYGVNAGIPKTLIRALIQYTAGQTDNDLLKKTLLDILDTPVSPELLPAKDGEITQKTEDLVGPYELHDFFLYYALRFGFEPEKILRLATIAHGERFTEEELRHWLQVFCRRFTSQQFKRSCLPDGVGIGSVSVSPRGGLKLPSDAGSYLSLK